MAQTTKPTANTAIQASKTTLYSRFSTKEQLFLAVIEQRMTRIFGQVAASLPEEPPIEDTPRDFGAAVIRLALSKDQVALVRVVGMESAKFPELGKRFYELGPKRGEETLAAYLKKQAEKGRLSKEDATKWLSTSSAWLQVVRLRATVMQTAEAAVFARIPWGRSMIAPLWRYVIIGLNTLD